MFAQHLVLRREDPLNRPHERPAFAGQVREHLTFEVRFEQVARTDPDPERDHPILSPPRSILENGEAGVQPRPATNIRRSEVPDPFGATRITSTSAGGTIPVFSLYVIPNPCEKYNAFPGVKCFFTVGHSAICPASDSRN